MNKNFKRLSLHEWICKPQTLIKPFSCFHYEEKSIKSEWVYSISISYFITFNSYSWLFSFLPQGDDGLGDDVDGDVTVAEDDLPMTSSGNDYHHGDEFEAYKKLCRGEDFISEK